MRVSQLAGAVFDVDGTLFDTERLSGQVWGEVGLRYGWLTAEADHLLITGRTRESIRQWIEERLGPDFPVEEFMSASSQRVQDRIEKEGVPLKPGVEEILAFLRERQVPMALATSTGQVRTLRRLELTGLGEYFQAVITGDQVRRSKPDPEIYLLACRRLGTPPERTLAVEDSFNGVRSAAAAGMPVALVPDQAVPTPEIQALAIGTYPTLLALRDSLME